MKDNIWVDTVSLSLFCYASVMKQNVNLVKSISKMDRIRTVNILFKVKLQALALELTALPKSCSPYALFSRNFESNYSSELL